MKDLLDKAANAYYAGTPFLSDEEFDSLAELSNYQQVGERLSGGIKHFYPMYSLQKYYEGDELPEWWKFAIATPKLDGSAISLLYVDHVLVMGLTRGDGVKSQTDITDKVVASPYIPNMIGEGGVVQITGEVVAPKEVPNARNYAAGALNLKSTEEFLSRNVNFIAYGMAPALHEQYESDLLYLENVEGFDTVLSHGISDIYPTDGTVYRVSSNVDFDAFGYTSKHPRGAFALKTQKEGIETTLRDVVWQVGKSGKVSPVAILDPIDIDGAKVSRATLHNIKYIRALNLEIGCQVKVIRSGEIIPRIVCRV